VHPESLAVKNAFLQKLLDLFHFFPMGDFPMGDFPWGTFTKTDRAHSIFNLFTCGKEFN
jgi:hypothetical protein